MFYENIPDSFYNIYKTNPDIYDILLKHRCIVRNRYKCEYWFNDNLIKSDSAIAQICAAIAEMAGNTVSWDDIRENFELYNPKNININARKDIQPSKSTQNIIDMLTNLYKILKQL